MPIRWRPLGGGVGTVDLSRLEGDQIVIHFGGSLTSVDAYTFANSLVAFADTVRAVNAAINPEQGIEIRLEALGTGSFRALVKRTTRGLGGFFSRGMESIFWGVVGTLLCEAVLKNNSQTKIIINTEEVVLQTGDDRVIIPRRVYDQMPVVRANPEVQRNLRKTFEVIEGDDAIENFGLTPRVDDREPLVQIPREEFSKIISPSPILIEDGSRRREMTERARMAILKAWLVPRNRKWAFEWNGVPISAPIKDTAFLERLAAREYLIGQGDALDVLIRYQQEFREPLGIYVSDPHTYEIVEVIDIIPSGGQLSTGQ